MPRHVRSVLQLADDKYNKKNNSGLLKNELSQFITEILLIHWGDISLLIYLFLN